MRQGFLQAAGVATYCALVGTFMWNASTLLGKEDTFVTPIVVLTLFCTSVMICGVIVFYKPYKLFFAGKKKEAADVVISTAIWLFVFLVFFFTTIFLIK